MLTDKFWEYFIFFIVVGLVGIISMYDNNRPYIGLLWLLCVFIVFTISYRAKDAGAGFYIIIITIVFILCLVSFEGTTIYMIALLLLSMMLFIYSIVNDRSNLLLSGIFTIIVIIIWLITIRTV